MCSRLVRIVIPRYPRPNQYSGLSITSLGPVMVATVINGLTGWKAEVIDENQYTGPVDSHGLPDHDELQRIRPAKVSGVYVGLTCTAERAKQIASVYRKAGVTVLAGGLHGFNCASETVQYADLVVHGEAEGVLSRIFENISIQRRIYWAVPGVSYFDEDRGVCFNPPAPESRNRTESLDSLPHPDFTLLANAERIRIYPINLGRGCLEGCEYCSVNGKMHSASAMHLAKTVDRLVESGARQFFLVDDNTSIRAIEFFEIIGRRYGRRLRFAIQARLDKARNSRFLDACEAGGVKFVNLGCETPNEAELDAMKKGYKTGNIERDMIAWGQEWSKRFVVNGMFIVGYPIGPSVVQLAPDVIFEQYRSFIQQVGFQAIQVLLTIPLPGTNLRKRLLEEGKVLPLDVAPWHFYDGNFPLFRPDGMTIRELHELQMRIMHWFYGPSRKWERAFQLLLSPFKIAVSGVEKWKRDLSAGILRVRGNRLLSLWEGTGECAYHLAQVEKFLANS